MHVLPGRDFGVSVDAFQDVVTVFGSVFVGKVEEYLLLVLVQLVVGDALDWKKKAFIHLAVLTGDDVAWGFYVDDGGLALLGC